MSDYAVATLTLHDALLIDNELLDFIQLDSEEQTQTMKDMFKARWDIYEIGGETIPLFKRFIENKFNSYKDYYQELIDDYEDKINYLSGIITNQTITDKDSAYGTINKTESVDENVDNIDLPNKTTSGNYITNKTHRSNNVIDGQTYADNKDTTRLVSKTGDVNILEQKKEYQKYLRNVYLEFAEKFKDCFVLVYN